MEVALSLVAGVLLGAGIVYLLTRPAARKLRAEEAESDRLRTDLAGVRESLAGLQARHDAELKAAEDKLALLEEARAKLQESFSALSSDALAKNNESFLNLAKATLEKYQEGAKSELEKRQQAIDKSVQPIGEALKNFNERVDAIEKERGAAYSGLREQVKHLLDAQAQLSRQTGSLVQALRAPQTRGRWGEMQLRRAVELAGMVNHCDFEEQASVEGEDGRLRPDMLIRLPNERTVVVDAKVPLAAYLDALEARDAEVQTERMRAHARQIRDHVKGLAVKSYWEQFESAPEFVVLFLPNEAVFSAALEQDPQLIEQGVANRVILATPTTLIALLKAIAYGWQQDAVAREAREIAGLGREIHERIGVLTDHFARLGRSLGQSVEHYNRAVNSMETRLLVTARKFERLDSTGTEGLGETRPLEKSPIPPRSTGAESPEA